MDDVRTPERDDGPDHDTSGLRRSAAPPTSPAMARWLEENGGAIEDYNRWYAEHGSPLDRYRRF